MLPPSSYKVLLKRKTTMNKILILGTFHNHETKGLTAAAQKTGAEVVTRLFSELSLQLNSGLNQLLKECEKFDHIVSRVEGRLANELRTILVTNSPIIRQRMLNGPSYSKYPILSKVQQYALFVTHDLPIPETWYQANYTEPLTFPIIIKGIVGSKGEAVHLVKNTTEFETLSNQYGQGGFITQTPLPIGEDYRILVLGGKVLGFMKKKASDGKFVTNIHAGGRAHLVEPERAPILEKLALATAQATECDFGGVDVMFDTTGQPRILEINRGAAYAGFEQINPINVSTEVINFMLNRNQNK